jgi:hypothetical protein
VCLPRWKDRVDSPAYRETQLSKKDGVKVLKAECPYEEMHRVDCLVNRNKIQFTHGAHCSLADVKHLYRHIQLNYLWPMIIELARYARKPHQVEEEAGRV